MERQVTVAALVADGFEQVEFTGPKEALEKAGAVVDTVSLQPGEVQGFHHFDRGERFPVHRTIDEVDAEEYDALLIPGGAHSPDRLRAEPEVLEFVRDFEAAGKPIASICHGPWVLVSAGVARGRTLTSYHTIRDDVINGGGNWVDEAPVRDGLLVTARSPEDLPAFNEAVIEMFGTAKAARRAA